MAFLDLVNNCKFLPVAGGTADFVYASAVTGFQSPTSAGALDTASYRYKAESLDLSQWEIGTCVYSSSTGTFVRTPIISSAGVATKENFTVPPRVGITFHATDIRRKLTAALTLFVRKDGADTNSGLADTAGGAFLTIGAAITAACAMDLVTFVITIQVRIGTYNERITTKYFVGGTATGIILQGDTTTPSNIIINNTAGFGCFNHSLPQPWTVRGFKFTASGVNAHAINAFNGGVVTYNQCEFGDCGSYHIWANSGGYVVGGVGCIISGPASFHWLLQQNSMLDVRGCSYTFATNPTNFSGAFCQATQCSAALTGSSTFTNASFATGRRFVTQSGSDISGAGTGQGLAYLPGSIAGTFAGGTYDGYSPQGGSNNQTLSAAYTTGYIDMGGTLIHPAADTTARTWTIDSNANVPYPIGTKITMVNQIGAGNLTIAVTTDTIRDEFGTSGPLVVPGGSVATALKITATEWLVTVSGNAEQWTALSADFNLANALGAQKAFNTSTNGAVTLASNTTYEFEAELYITDTGATAHAWQFQFGGTATITSGFMRSLGHASAAPQAATNEVSSITLGTAMALSAASSGAISWAFHITGRVRINAGGTFIPQVNASAAPGAVPVMKAGSMFKIRPVGPATVAAVGNWS